METAVETVSNKTVLDAISWLDKASPHEYKVYLHFADFQNSQLRQFNVSLNKYNGFQYSPPYLESSPLGSSNWDKSDNGLYTVKLVPTAASVLPPMLNAYELYTRIPHVNPKTLASDCKHSLPILLDRYYSVFLWLEIYLANCGHTQ